MQLTMLVGMSLAATGAIAAPLTTRQDSGKTVVYWGQNAAENSDLSTYCGADTGIDIIVLSFLYEYGNGVTVPSGTIGQSCSISTTGEGENCGELAAAISTCQANGVEVIVSLGGASGSYALTSQAEAETIGQNLWDAYGKSTGGSVPRPFGDTFVNGWDFDIESNSGNDNYQYLISKLRSNFASDPSNTYYITGAPQCPVPEPNMNTIITQSQFDYLWVQFYNNPSCSVTGTINFDEWKNNIANTPSADAKIFLGVPASPMASTGTDSGSKYYLEPADLAKLATDYSGEGAFGGIMMWAAGFSDANVVNGCTYAQQSLRILTTGSCC